MNFFVFTTGRTGSTAICDELNSRAGVICWQEIFINIHGDRVEQKGGSLADEEAHFGESGLPFQVYQHVNPGATVDEFLAYTENRSAQMGTTMGFKLLYHHPALWEDGCLLHQLKARGYVCLHLIRQDHIGRVLSGMIARARGVYNTKQASEPNKESILIDPLEFAKFFRSGIATIERAQANLKEVGLQVSEIYYDDFLADRIGFHAKISKCLDLTDQEIRASDYKKVTPSRLGDLIENYDAVKSSAAQVLEEIAADR